MVAFIRIKSYVILCYLYSAFVVGFVLYGVKGFFNFLFPVSISYLQTGKKGYAWAVLPSSSGSGFHTVGIFITSISIAIKILHLTAVPNNSVVNFYVVHFEFVNGNI